MWLYLTRWPDHDQFKGEISKREEINERHQNRVWVTASFSCGYSVMEQSRRRGTLSKTISSNYIKSSRAPDTQEPAKIVNRRIVRGSVLSFLSNDVQPTGRQSRSSRKRKREVQWRVSANSPINGAAAGSHYLQHDTVEVGDESSTQCMSSHNWQQQTALVVVYSLPQRLLTILTQACSACTLV